MRTIRLTTCGNSYEAHLIKNSLEAEGIGCAIHNENMSNIFGGLISAFSGVDIFVYEDQVEKANEIMDNMSNSEVPDYPWDHDGEGRGVYSDDHEVTGDETDDYDNIAGVLRY